MTHQTDLEWVTCEVLATSVGVVEGPVWHNETLWYTRLDGGGTVQRLVAGRIEDYSVVGGGANGLAVDHAGVFYVTNWGGHGSSTPSVIQRVTKTTVEILVDEVDGGPFRHCNDLCFGPDGWLYFTDSGESFQDSTALFEAGAAPEHPGLVCRVHPAIGVAEVLNAALYMPNGLAFSPGDDVLYVADTVAHCIVAFPFADRQLGPPDVRFDIDGNPDGMCLDVDGRLYVATAIAGEIHVLSRRGELERRLRWADQSQPLNCCFGGPTRTTLFVTDIGGLDNVPRAANSDPTTQRIVAIPLNVSGLALHG